MAPAQTALVDLLDRLLVTGVTVDAELTLSIADIDLVTVSLRALLSSGRAGGPHGDGAERQAIHRIDQGDLTDEQIERLGATLMALEDEMAELRDHFGLSTADLNLDLGPLGPLLPRD